MRCRAGTCCTATCCCMAGSLATPTFYTFELPLYAIAEIFTGLHSVTIHLGAALTYLIVVASAVAVARTDSRGLSTAARCGVVIAVLAAPLLTSPGVGFVLENARSHRDRRDPAGLLPADRPGSGLALHAAAALRDPHRRPGRRRHRPLCRGTGGPGRLCLSRPGHSEAPRGREPPQAREPPHGRRGDGSGRRRVRAAGVPGSRGDRALRRLR